MGELIFDVNLSDYVNLPGTTQSALKALRKSPRHHQQFLKDRGKPTEEMLRGTAAHTAVLEPDRFLLDYVLWDGGRRYGKDWDKFRAANKDKTILRPDDYHDALKMRDAVRGHATAADLVESGHAEVTIQWQDERTKMLCKGRIDYLIGTPAHPVVVGLKTARDVSERDFRNQAARLGYHIQWAYYHDGYYAITGTKPRMFEVVVESSAPHDVVVYEIGDQVLEVGRAEYRRLLEQLALCTLNDSWPGICPDGVIEFSLPHWAMPSVDELIVGGERVAI